MRQSARSAVEQLSCRFPDFFEFLGEKNRGLCHKSGVGKCYLLMIIIIVTGAILYIAFAYLLICFVSVFYAFFEKTARKEIFSIFQIRCDLLG